MLRDFDVTDRNPLENDPEIEEEFINFCWNPDCQAEATTLVDPLGETIGPLPLCDDCAWIFLLGQENPLATIERI